MMYKHNYWQPEGKQHAYEHEPFKCVKCDNLVYAVGLWGYCEKCEANYMLLEEDYNNTMFVDRPRTDRHTYFIEYQNKRAHKRENESD